MEILRIEPTPSPNTMKVVLSYTRETSYLILIKSRRKSTKIYKSVVIYRWYHFHFSCHELLSC